jgi:hypothetical protein
LAPCQANAAYWIPSGSIVAAMCNNNKLTIGVRRSMLHVGSTASLKVALALHGPGAPCLQRRPVAMFMFAESATTLQSWCNLIGRSMFNSVCSQSSLNRLVSGGLGVSIVRLAPSLSDDHTPR